ncbi:MAG: hypothetical protein ABR555_17200 [Pyrinomonadaceae bacterium]
MRKEKALISLLKELVDLISKEAAQNPEFARKLELLLSPLPAKKLAKRKRPAKASLDLPDVYREYNARGQAEFTLWLRDQPIDLLRAVIRSHDLDATRRTSKWKDQGKLSHFITEQIRSRMARGSGFLTSAT